MKPENLKAVRVVSAVEKKTTVQGFKELYYQKGCSVRRIAEIIGTSPSSVRRYMRRHNLERRLSRYNLTFDHIAVTELAYFAGLFDGEGNITATADKNGITRAEVSVCNTDEGILEWRRFFTHHRIRENVGYDGRTRVHVLYTHNFKDAYSLLSSILPYLKLKKVRAGLMIRTCQSRMRRFRKPMSAEERNWVKQLRALNSPKGKRR